MQSGSGGFGGGHGQMAHCASSYAMTLSLAMVGGQEAFSLIDRLAWYSLSLSIYIYICFILMYIVGDGWVSSSRRMAGFRSASEASRMSGEFSLFFSPSHKV